MNVFSFYLRRQTMVFFFWRLWCFLSFLFYVMPLRVTPHLIILEQKKHFHVNIADLSFYNAVIHISHFFPPRETPDWPPNFDARVVWLGILLFPARGSFHRARDLHAGTPSAFIILTTSYFSYEFSCV
ncbi:hypothetical protein GGR53DRAFT_453694 [Hypoxylon sp. FL1150]|nr:hypothetical protein GGR53DRAFT_453694 [Hypoxylon sp. FL1150]